MTAHDSVDVIDAHVHVWDPGVLPYEWLGGTDVNRAMLPSEYDRGGVGVTGAVFVQAADGPVDPIAEARWVNALERRFTGRTAPAAHQG